MTKETWVVEYIYKSSKKYCIPYPSKEKAKVALVCTAFNNDDCISFSMFKVNADYEVIMRIRNRMKDWKISRLELRKQLKS